MDEKKNAKTTGEASCLTACKRGVAQPGSALGSGPRSRRFKSSRPDIKHIVDSRE